MAKKSVTALVTVGLLVVVFAVCLVSATQLLAPRDMPFGVTGSSPVVDAVEKEYSLDLITYQSEADLTAAAKRGDIYGGYIPDSSGDKLVTVPAKSFFGEVYVSAGFKEAAAKSNSAYTTTVVAPLPLADRMGGVIGLLLLPTLIGGYMIASLMFSATQTAAAPGRIAIAVAFAVVVAVITGVAAGPILGPSRPVTCGRSSRASLLVTAAVGLAAVAIQAVVGKLGTLVVALLFILIGGAGAGGGGVSLPAELLADNWCAVPATARREPIPECAVLRRQRHRHPSSGAGRVRARRHRGHRAGGTSTCGGRRWVGQRRPPESTNDADHRPASGCFSGASTGWCRRTS